MSTNKRPGRPQIETPRDKVVQACLTQAEYEALRRYSGDRSVSDVVRELILRGAKRGARKKGAKSS